MSRGAVPGQPQNVIRVVMRDGTLEREITAAGATALNSLDYTADGKGFFTSDYSTDVGARLLHVSMTGKVTVLWNNRGSLRTWGVPSPDGRWLAMLGSTHENNVWVLEGFMSAAGSMSRWMSNGRLVKRLVFTTEDRPCHSNV